MRVCMCVRVSERERKKERERERRSRAPTSKRTERPPANKRESIMFDARRKFNLSSVLNLSGTKPLVSSLIAF